MFDPNTIKIISTTSGTPLDLDSEEEFDKVLDLARELFKFEISENVEEYEQ